MTNAEILLAPVLLILNGTKIRTVTEQISSCGDKYLSVKTTDNVTLTCFDGDLCKSIMELKEESVDIICAMHQKYESVLDESIWRKKIPDRQNETTISKTFFIMGAISAATFSQKPQILFKNAMVLSPFAKKFTSQNGTKFVSFAVRGEIGSIYEIRAFDDKDENSVYNKLFSLNLKKTDIVSMVCEIKAKQAPIVDIDTQNALGWSDHQNRQVQYFFRPTTLRKQS